MPKINIGSRQKQITSLDFADLRALCGFLESIKAKCSGFFGVVLALEKKSLKRVNGTKFKVI
jgi:hypothetical protein